MLLHGERRGESPPYDWLPPEKRLWRRSTSKSCCFNTKNNRWHHIKHEAPPLAWLVSPLLCIINRNEWKLTWRDQVAYLSESSWRWAESTWHSTHRRYHGNTSGGGDRLSLLRWQSGWATGTTFMNMQMSWQVWNKQCNKVKWNKQRETNTVREYRPHKHTKTHKNRSVQILCFSDSSLHFNEALTGNHGNKGMMESPVGGIKAGSITRHKS